VETDEIDRLPEMALVCGSLQRYTEVPAFFNPATIKKQKGKAEDLILLSTLNSPAKDYFSILVMK
jgi:hypothetical protein